MDFQSFDWPRFGLLTLFFPLFVFLCVLIYYLVRPKKYRWIVLLVFSLAFYLLVDWKSILFILPTIIVVYISSILIERLSNNDTAKSAKTQTAIIVIAIVLIGGVLFVLKYFNFIGESVFKLFGKPFNVIDFIIPLGLSYYTFQSIAYLVDVKMKKTEAVKNPFKLALFLMFFPAISMGPISRINQVRDALFNGNDFDEQNIWDGIYRILFGYLKKIAIADMIAIPIALAFNNYKDFYGFVLMLAALGFAIQLYCDFSGCMDIGLGVAKLFGITLPENFDRPYTAPTIQAFWRRWHMTLTSWFRDYIYIPLGGNRVKLPRYLLNIMIVWLFTGLWHGANWTFVVWGVYNGLLLIVAILFKKWKPDYENKHKDFLKKPGIIILRTLRTFVLVCIGWVFFNSKSIGDAFGFIGHSLIIWKFDGVESFFNSLPLWAWISVPVLIALCIILYTPFTKREGYIKKFSFTFSPYLISIISMIVVFIVVIMKAYLFSTGSGSSGFIYFDF